MRPLRLTSPVLALLAAVLVLAVLFAGLSEWKPIEAWQALDIAGEGGLALLATAWAVVVLSSRPGGRVTALLGGGLSALALAAWADVFDEFLHTDLAWIGWVESSLAPLGMVVLSIGLVLWRQEQFVLAEQLGPLEGEQRDHRAFDRLTRLADAGYLRQQMARCRTLASVVMLELPERLALERQHGARIGARLMQAVAQQLLLNLRQQDLLCRYAGDRLVVLMPQTTPDAARQRAAHLQRMVEGMRVHVGEQVLPIRLRLACAPLDGDPQATLSSLSSGLDAAPVPAT